jgi:hypothetical protein
MAGNNLTASHRGLERGMITFGLIGIGQREFPHGRIEGVARRTEIALVVAELSLAFAWARASTQPQACA